MTRLRKTQLSKMSDELRERTLGEFRERIHRSVRNGEGHKTWFHLHLVFEFDRSLPAHRRLKVQEILALFPEPLRSVNSGNRLLKSAEVKLPRSFVLFGGQLSFLSSEFCAVGRVRS